MLVYITDYNGEMSGQDLGPEAGRYGRNHVGVYGDCMCSLCLILNSLWSIRLLKC
jgi:hypothetical protein